MSDRERKNTVPLKKVVLYKHGMGYFERRGTVDTSAVNGAGSIEILCGASDIDDMLKSLMVLSADGARIQAITYDSAKTLEDRMVEFGFDVRHAQGLIDIIAQMKGLPVAVYASGTTISGRALGIDIQEQIAEDGRVINEPFLIVLQDGTFRRISLNSILSIRVEDKAFATELNQQLELLFQNAKKKDKKALTVKLPETKGEVVVAYSIPSPIWKTSYRLVLVQGKLLIQGMAIVDNVQDEDWNEVDVVLVSAAPISFIQPLYDPVQPYRKRIATQGYQSAGPVMAERGQVVAASIQRAYGSSPPPMPAAAPAAQMAMDSWGSVDSLGAKVGALSDRAEARSAASMLLESDAEIGIDTASSGELFEYRVSNPVTIPRNTSALIPIVQQSVEGEKLSLYNQEKNSKHPYSTIRLKNTSGLTLEGGPVTVVEEDSYAGEALLDVLKPGDTRFLPYALDQDCHVIIRNEYDRRPVYKARMAGQTLYLDYRERNTTLYRLENLSEKEKMVYVEHRLNARAKLVGDHKPVETTQHFHRFEVKLNANQLYELAVIEEQQMARTVYVADPDRMDVNGLTYFLRECNVGGEMMEFLKSVLAKQQEVARVQLKRNALNAKLQQYQTDQARARDNLKALGTSNERYRRAIDEAEDNIISTNQQLAELSDQYDRLRAEFMEMIDRQIEAEISS